MYENDQNEFVIPHKEPMHKYFSSAPFMTCTYIEFLHQLNLEQKLKSIQQRSIDRFYMKLLNPMSEDQELPQFAQDHAKKLLKEMTSNEVIAFWDSMAEHEKCSTSKEQQVRSNVSFDGSDVTRSRLDHESSYSPPLSEMKKLLSLTIDLDDNNEDDEITIIRNVPQLSLNNSNDGNEFVIEDYNVSKLFQQYQNESYKLANSDGLYVETNVHKILSLTSILMLSPNSHSEMMMNIFGLDLLDKISENLKPNKQEFNAEYEAKFRNIIRQSSNISRDNAINSLLGHLAESESRLKENLGFVILDGLKSLPNHKLKSKPSEITLITNYLDYIMKGLFHLPDKYIVEWPNTGLKETKARKIEGRARQPDFLVSAIHQLETSGTLFIGEVTSPAEKENVHKNCNDLIRIGVFMKECIDSALDKGADIKVLGFQCIEYTIDFYAIKLNAPGLYIMHHIGQASIPTSVKTLSHFVDEIDTFLTVRSLLQESFGNFNNRLRNPKEQAKKLSFKCETLSTPSFNQLVSKTRNVKRKCSFWFGRF
ncbi:C2H2-type zinc finger transcription factor [Rhizophagus irregularis DAOM 181602=DAOM 197198]|nr:C2H2-type zinc finger transcription factor [Rhizophagus irregularis DAOM 181602=DAOM 197198]